MVNVPSDTGQVNGFAQVVEVGAMHSKDIGSKTLVPGQVSRVATPPTQM